MHFLHKIPGRFVEKPELMDERLNELDQLEQISTSINVRTIVNYWNERNVPLGVLFDGMRPRFKDLCENRTTFVPYRSDGIENVSELVARSIAQFGDPHLFREIGRRIPDLSSADDQKALARLLRLRPLLLLGTPAQTHSFNRILNIGIPYLSWNAGILGLDYSSSYTGEKIDGIVHWDEEFTQGAIEGIDINMVEDGLRMLYSQRIYQAKLQDVVSAHNTVVGRQGNAYSDVLLETEFRREGVYVNGDLVGVYVDNVRYPVKFEITRNERQMSREETEIDLLEKQDSLDGVVELCGYDDEGAALVEGSDYFDVIGENRGKILITKPGGLVIPGRTAQNIELLREGCIYGADTSIAHLSLPRVSLREMLTDIAEVGKFSLGGYFILTKKIKETQKALEGERDARKEAERQKDEAERQRGIAEGALVKLEGTYEELAQAYAQLEDARQAETAFSALVAHDTTNPLTALKESVRVLQADTEHIFSGWGADDIGVVREIHLKYGSDWEEATVCYINDYFEDRCEVEPEDFQDAYNQFDESQKAVYNRLDTAKQIAESIIEANKGQPHVDEFERAYRTIVDIVENELKTKFGGVVDVCDEVMERVKPLTMLASRETDGSDPLREIEEIDLTEITYSCVKRYSKLHGDVDLYCDLPDGVVVDGNATWVTTTLEKIFSNATTQIKKVEDAQPYDKHGIYLFAVDDRLYVGNTGPEIKEGDPVYKTGSTTGGQGFALTLMKETLSKFGCELNHIVERDEISDLVQSSPFRDTNINVLFYLEFKND